ncbi:NUDIX hydrolase [Solicola sp. PLA-1-18]|uniref:NUDIX hydrolase n=1 Tax=Solicola sp. PLA-1-18 TaxID=3380532 RepID=UPI003B7F1A65
MHDTGHPTPADPSVAKYVRFESPEPNARGHHIGVFGLVNSLARDGLLTPPEEAFRRATNDWFDRAYTDPSSVDASIYNHAINPVTRSWFKTSAQHLIDRVDGYLRILRAHGVAYVRIECHDPGPVLYEDAHQVVAGAHGTAWAAAATPRSLRVPDAVAAVAELVRGLNTRDDLAVQHQQETLAWLSSTDDIYRRVKPKTPSPHLVSYFLVVDRPRRRFLLCDHRLAGRWLPAGGHVEPGEDPAQTVRREAKEELGLDVEFDPVVGARPFFLTVTETVGDPDSTHVDVSLWFAVRADSSLELAADEREFAAVQWWTRDQLLTLDPGRVEPHLVRALDALNESVR